MKNINESRSKRKKKEKFNRVSRILTEINERAREREEERKRELNFPHPALSSLYSHPLSFLRSLPPPSEIEQEEKQVEQEPEEKEDEETLSSGGLGARETGQRPQPYLRLFENPPRLLVERPRVVKLPSKEEKFYREALSELPTELLNEIYKFSTIPEEINSPREFCYLQLQDAEEKLLSETSSSSTPRISPCQENINHFVQEVESEKTLEQGGNISFEDVQCSIYCLFTNLPKFYTIREVHYREDTGEKIEGEDEEDTFALCIVIDNFDSKNNRLRINIRL
jgi:hypothetical protein